MSFRENLLQKISIDDLARNVISTLKAPDSGLKFDKAKMRQLLEMGPYRHQRERDLDLYILKAGPRKGAILVLDNGLAIYETTIEDVVMRKSPTVKEMVSIRNAIKILNDKDVVRTRRADSVNSVREVLIGQLDLTYESRDIEAIAAAGRDSLENQYGPGVEETLRLFTELLSFITLPKPFAAHHHDVVGRKHPSAATGLSAAPIVIYNRIENTLKLLKGPLDSRDITQMEHYQQTLAGEAEPDIAGGAVLDWLQRKVTIEKPVIGETA